MKTLTDFQTSVADLKLSIHGAIVVLTCRCGFPYIKFKNDLLINVHKGHDNIPCEVELNKLNTAEDTMVGVDVLSKESEEMQLEDMTIDQLMWVLEQMEGGLYAEMSMTDFFD
jgi:hypothetical protein